MKTEYEPPKPGSRDGAGRFVAGTSGNPTGKRQVSHDFAAVCREHAPAALERLAQIMRGKGSAAVRAAEIVLSYAHGKPVQNVSAIVRSGVLDDARFRGAARAALEAAVTEAEAAIPPIPEVT